MKFFRFHLRCLSLAVLPFYGCQSSQDSQLKEATKQLETKKLEASILSIENGTYVLDNDLSIVRWYCGDDTGTLHNGSFKFAGNSEFNVYDGQILSGQINVDVNSLSIRYLPDWAAEKLAEELISPVFLNGLKYPYAQVSIYPAKETSSETLLPIALFLSGENQNLTLPIEMDYLSHRSVVVRGDVPLDRTVFGMNHRASFDITEDSDPQISIIDHIVEIQVEVHASLATN